MKKIKKNMMRRGMPAVMSAALLLTSMPVAAAAAEPSAPIMEGVLSDAIQQRNGQTQLALQTGDNALMWDTSYFNPDPAQAEARSQAADIPFFDLRDQKKVTPVKLQNPFGTCWGFATIAAAESSILSERGLDYDPVEHDFDLSEMHLAWFSAHALPEDSGTGQGGEGTYSGAATAEGLNSGGEMYYGTTAFASGVGPRSEKDIPYQPKDPENHKDYDPATGIGAYSPDGDWSVDESERFGIDFELEESSLLPSPAGRTLDADGASVYCYNEAGTTAIKNELLAGRAVSIAFSADTSLPGQESAEQYINTDTWAHYTYDYSDPTHAVTIVGWDDDYAVSNFKEGHQPEGPGAWIVKNSWGAGSNTFPHKNKWGNDGYFYLSYYDHSICMPETFDFFTERTGYESVYVNQYDYMTAKGIDIHETDKKVSEANVFYAEDGDMTLRCVAATTSKADAKVTYDIYRLNENFTSPTDGTLAESISAVYPYAGYHRAYLSTEQHFRAGEAYAVVVTQESDGKYLYGAATAPSKDWWDSLPEDERAISQYSVGVIHKGESFLGGPDENGRYDWMDWKDFAHGYIAGTGNTRTLDNFAIKTYSDPYTFPPKADLSTATVTLGKTAYTYTGGAKTPSVTVTAAGAALINGKDYTVTYKNNKNAGTATAVVTAKASSGYTGSKSATFTIHKAAQTLKLNVSKKDHQAEALAKKKATFTIKPSKNKTAVAYKVTKGSPKYISVSKKGVVTMKKGAKKGVYKVRVTAKASANYKSAQKIVTIKVK